MILLIDNYDSFTYNIVQALGIISTHLPICVRRNDEVSLDDIRAWPVTHLIISAGPGTPDTGGISLSAIQHFACGVPILGICLGHQCICQAFGGRVTRAPELMHGKTSDIDHDGRTIFRGVGNPLRVGRYHSLAVDGPSLPAVFEVSARTQDGRVIMGLRHRTLPIEGVQFHPDSYLTTHGSRIFSNFLAR